MDPESLDCREPFSNHQRSGCKESILGLFQVIKDNPNGILGILQVPLTLDHLNQHPKNTLDLSKLLTFDRLDGGKLHLCLLRRRVLTGKVTGSKILLEFGMSQQALLGNLISSDQSVNFILRPPEKSN